MSRINISKLSDELRDLLRQGESVEIEDSGEIVAHLTPEIHAEARKGPGNLKRYLEAREIQPPLDEAFVHDMESVLEGRRRPIGLDPWDE